MHNNEFPVIHNSLSLTDVLTDLYVSFIYNCRNSLAWQNLRISYGSPRDFK